jgi:DNA helicase II / ATP-dependent DNA helicase PcrA
MVGKINETLEKVKDCINTGKSFIVEAGAGSGKTWTLIESIKHILVTQATDLEKGNQKIACITYTNVAKDEIIVRIDNNPLVLVLTIHEFLWFAIKNYQKELKSEIIKYNQTDNKKHVENLESKIKQTTIEYSQYGRKFEEGKITHDDVLMFSSILFNTYPKLSNIVANKFPFLFIDEYQDTEERTVELLLDNLLTIAKGKIVIGFFGDSMQKIYNQGIGSIPFEYIDNEKLTFITKNENFRCSLKVIELLGKIRPDLIQSPTGNNLLGEIIFIHCNNNISNTNGNYLSTLEFIKNTKGWELESNTKILLLTHRGIANKLGYEKLLAVYDTLDFGRDKLLNKEEPVSNFILNNVEILIRLYLEKNYREFIKKLGIDGFVINYHIDKNRISLMMDTLIELRKKVTIKEVMNYIFNNSLLTKPIKLDEFEVKVNNNTLDENEIREKKFHDDLMNVKYSEFIQFNEFVEKFTPYSTKHGVKGSEYDNVLVVIDDNSWFQYKFNDVFANIKNNQDRYDRTRNLLYVCSSRAKNNLIFLSLSKMDEKAMQTINNWFGSENVYDINNL